MHGSHDYFEGVYINFAPVHTLHIPHAYAHTNTPRACIRTHIGEVVDLDEYDPNVVASLLKQYLREFPEPLVSPRITGRLEAAAGMCVCVCESMGGLISEWPHFRDGFEVRIIVTYRGGLNMDVQIGGREFTIIMYFT